jgi:hypothetical protein
MNINPFDLLKNFQNIQAKMNEAQEKLKDLVVTGSSGGDMVRIEMNGRLDVLSVRISPEAYDPEDPGILQDLVRAAMTDTLYKIKEAIRVEMTDLTGGMNLPPGFMGMG